MATARFRPPRPQRTSPSEPEASQRGDESAPRVASSEARGAQDTVRPTGPFVRSDNGGVGTPTDEDLAGPMRRAPRVRAPRRTGPRIQGDLVGKQGLQGHLPGDRYVRVCRVQTGDFERAAPGHLIATEEALEARGAAGRAFGKLKRTLIGAPISTAQAAHERLTKPKALAVLSSDALSSVAYATEEILHVLLLAGLGALALSLPIGAAIVALLLIVGISYRQTIKAYPQGGGSYIVAKDNLGDLPALTAGAALLFGYIVTVSVSISAGVAALTSAAPALRDYRIPLGLGFILLVTVLNLRGIRESGSIFSVPTYLFLVGIIGMIGLGLVRAAGNGFVPQVPVAPAGDTEIGTQTLGILLILTAFSRGCAALTGVEAISDGVQAFQPPEWKNARSTLTWMIGILAVTFAGITFLANQFGVVPLNADHPEGYETVVSQIARTIFGADTPAYYYIQVATLAILILAANTAYSDFPRLSYFLARDRYLPKQFTFRGDRLAYSTGIITLGLLSSLMLWGFGGETTRMIPLYAVGVFTAFTLSQGGMVVRWLRLKEPGWRSGLAINVVGVLTTGLVAIVVGFTNFTRGAWIVLLLIPILILMFRGIHRHYDRAAGELAAQTPLDPSDIEHTVVVPIAAVNRVARQTLAYARSISPNVTAVHITDDEAEIERIRADWEALDSDIPLIIIESPYRSLVGPLLSYLDELDRQRPDDTLTVVLPEFIARKWWEQILHNQTALRIKAALLFRPGTVVTSVPYHLERRGPKPVAGAREAAG
jgi:amino acid transporter